MKKPRAFPGSGAMYHRPGAKARRGDHMWSIILCCNGAKTLIFLEISVGIV
jgi:hypothetical protein